MESKVKATIEKIDTKITELLNERALLEKTLAEDRKLLPNFLTAEAMGEIFDREQLKDLRARIDKNERRVNEINATIFGLQERKKAEEANLKNYKIEVLKASRKKTNLELFKILRERIEIKRREILLVAEFNKYYQEHDNQETELRQLGCELKDFRTPETKESIEGWVSPGLEPLVDIKDGTGFLDGLIKKMEREVK